MPPRGDSLIRTGALARRTLHLQCAPALIYLEVGDVARCRLDSGITEGFITSFTPLDSFPELHASNPAPIAIQGDGVLLARAPGETQIWTTYGGARAVEGVSVGPRTGGLRLLPAVEDTTIEVGQTFRFRVAYYDTTGLEQQDRRGVAMAYARWDNPGKLDTIGLNAFALTGQAPGRIQFTAMRGRRHASVMIRVVPAKVIAPAPASTPVRTERPRTARDLPASVQIQVIDSVSAPRAIWVSIGSRMLITTPDGWYRGMDDTGTVVIAVYCPVPGRPAGRKLTDTTVRLVAGANPRVRIRTSSAGCDGSFQRQAAAIYTGHYRNGLDETFTSCRALGPITNADADSGRVAVVVIEAPGYVPKRLDDTARYFARFEGTLSGPGSYGPGGTTPYYLRVTRVLELRPARPADCR